MRTSHILAALALTVIGAAPAAAQEAGKVGLVAHSGSGMGLQIQLSDTISLRPDIGFSRSTSKAPVGDDKSTNTSVAPGVSVLVFAKTWDQTRLYLAPRWQYTRQTTSGSDARTVTHTISGSVGAQHQLGNRFAVFGETGVAYGDGKAKNGSTTVGKISMISTRSLVGGILFF